MRGGRGWLAVAIAAIAIAGATAASRVGPASSAPAAPGAAMSTTWLCPHGGGPGWTGTIEIANPGVEPVHAQLTSYAGDERRQLHQLDVPPHGEVLQEVPASARDATTRVDLFGGWAAVGWTVWAGRGASGLGAEPCTAQPGPSWSVIDGVTDRRTHSFLVVVNPFTGDAVIDVALFLAERPPVRSDDWTDLPVDAGTSVALDLAAKRSGALGEKIIGAEVRATVGRVAVSSLSVHQGGGIRAVLATPTLANRWILPTTAGSGTGTLSLLVPQETPIRYVAGQRTADPESQAVDEQTESRQSGTSSASTQVGTLGPAAVVLGVQEGGPIAAALREDGAGTDAGATGGAAGAATGWILLPTAFGLDPRPAVVLVNDGDTAVSATLTLLHEGGGSLDDATKVSVPPRAAVGVPGTFLREDHAAAVQVTADGPVVALGAGTAGAGDSARYAMAIGVPIPEGMLPAGT